MSLSSSLKPLLYRLLTAPTAREPAVQESVAEAKQLARERGLYVTAFEIRDRLSRMPRTDDEGNRFHKERGYLLAGDFIWSHIRGEIAAVKNSPEPVGPNIFRGYCSEMIDCLLHGENVRRGIEMPVLIVDGLLFEAVERFEKSAVYLGLATQTSKAITELIQQRFEQQKTRLRRKSEAQPEDDLSTPFPDTPYSTIDEPVLAYTERLHQQLEHIRRSFSRLYEGSPEPLPQLPDQLQEISRIAEDAEYLPFSASVKERIGLLLEPAQPEEASRLFISAGERYELQGDEERQLFFSKLCTTRYEKARKLFLRATDDERASQLQSKIGRTASHGKR
jgi:hypothetical protein